MRIGISNAVMYPELSEVSIEKLTNAGFNLFEYFYNCDSELTSDFLKEIRKKAKEAEFVSMHPYTAFAENVFFFSAYSRRKEESVEKYKRSFLAAKEMGVKYFTFHGERNYENSATYGQLNKENEEVLQTLSDVAAECGVKLCLENVSWCKSSNIEYLKDVAQKIDGIGFTLDLKQARRADVDYREYVRTMGDKICNIHVSDFDNENDCILPGRGKFNFTELKNEIEKIGYTGDVLIEVYSQSFSDASELFESKRFLENIFCNS